MKKSNLVKAGYPYTGIIDWEVEMLKKHIVTARSRGSLPEFGLRRVEIHPTSFCQYKCPFCYGINFKHKQKIDLPLDIIENNILKSIRDSRLAKDDPIIILAGLYSEPLAHSGKIKLIKLLGKYKFRFGIYTNGGFLDNEAAIEICKSAKYSTGKLTSYISFNVIGAIANGDYKSLEMKMKNFIKVRDAIKAPVQVNVPILIDGSISAKDLKKLQAKLLRIGVDKIRYSMPQAPVSTGRTSKPALNDIKLIESLGKGKEDNVFVRSISGKQFDHCYVLANTVSIDHKGLVYPCSQTCSDNFKELAYGSIKEKKLSYVWNSRRHKDIFKNFNKIPTYCRCNVSDRQFNSVCSFLAN